MSPAPAYGALVEQVKSIRASLRLTTDPDARNRLFEELGEVTKQLTELILKREERLKSPLGS